jgi:DNA-binding NtrC family response regulator
MSPAQHPTLPILMVDDEEQALRSFGLTLRAAGMTNVVSCDDPTRVLPMLAERAAGAVLLDLWMPQLSGEELLGEIVARYPEVPVLVVTGVNEVETAVRCMKAGAFDYLVKPVERDRLVGALTRAVEVRELRHENALLRDRLLSAGLEHPEAFASIVTRNAVMLAVFRYVEAIARTSQPVLIEGETGVGKELVARAVHASSGREGDFVAVNVAGLDDQVFSDTLFGHRRGAFTGADEARAGLVERAAEGTLFLDEIGDLGLASQVKLLRLLQEREYFPLGADLAKRSSARVVVSTNQDLLRLQQDGRFRRDLFYRLRTHHLRVPPLRERRDDLPLLVDHFVAEAAKSLGLRPPAYPRELLALLGAYSFPGNVRELAAMVYDALSTHRSGVLSLESFRAATGLAGAPGGAEALADAQAELAFPERMPTLRQVVTAVVDEAMRRAQGNQAIAARLLGISRQALNHRLRHPRG